MIEDTMSLADAMSRMPVFDYNKEEINTLLMQIKCTTPFNYYFLRMLIMSVIKIKKNGIKFAFRIRKKNG